MKTKMCWKEKCKEIDYIIFIFESSVLPEVILSKLEEELYKNIFFLFIDFNTYFKLCTHVYDSHFL